MIYLSMYQYNGENRDAINTLEINKEWIDAPPPPLLLSSDPELSCRLGVWSTPKSGIKIYINAKVVFALNYVTKVPIELAAV